MKSENVSVSVRLFETPWIIAHYMLLCPWDFPGKNTGIDHRFLLQGIFPTWRLNPGLPHCREILYHPTAGSTDY